jgi:hypothetical protein
MECSFYLVLITSLKILFVWAAMQSGMILYPLRWLIDQVLFLLPVKAELILRKPFYSCVTCMSSIYGILFTLDQFEISFSYLTLLFAIGGLNYMLQLFIQKIGGGE